MDVKEENRKAKIKAYSKQKSGIIEDIGNNMVKIKENSFRMGSSDGEDDEKPLREVFLDDWFGCLSGKKNLIAKIN